MRKQGDKKINSNLYSNNKNKIERKNKIGLSINQDSKKYQQ